MKQEDKQEDPKKCTPEQVAECHPDAAGHPCEQEKKEDPKSNHDA